MLALIRRMRSKTSCARELALLLCATVGAGGTSGCSFLFVDGPPANAKRLPAFTCTSSNALPAVDGVIAGLAAISAAGALVEGQQTYDTNTGMTVTKPDYTAAVGAAAWGALFAASAFVGHSRVSECKEATEDLMNRYYQTAPGRGFGPGQAAPIPYAPTAPYDPWAPAPGIAPAPPAAPPAQAAPPAPVPTLPAPGATPPAPGAPPPAPAPGATP
jgi:hypothetical protein